MTEPTMFQYPALYHTASRLSAESQHKYLNLLRIEYLLLFAASIFSFNFVNSQIFSIFCALVFLGCLAALLVRSWLKPEQDWYRGRALAESIKTSCWRYCMRAEPFGEADDVDLRRAEFRNHLRAILEANRYIGDRLPPDGAANDQITESMETVRSANLEQRREFYDNHRIREQRTWYAKKAISNRNASRNWVRAGIAAYFAAIVIVLVRVAYPAHDILSTDPLIVVASAIIGWMQTKKFNELSSSYTLTAHEIGIIQGRVAEVADNRSFSDFVNEAEQAFSREHTQWVARQQAV